MPNSIDAALNITNLSAISSGSPAFMRNGSSPENFTSSVPVSGNYTADDLVAQLEPLYDSEEKLISAKDFEDQVLKGYNLLRSRKEKRKYAYMVTEKYNIFPALKEYFKEYKFKLDASDTPELKSVLENSKQVMPDKAGYNFNILMNGVANYLLSMQYSSFHAAYSFLTNNFDSAVKVYGYEESANIFIEEITTLRNRVRIETQRRLEEGESENADKLVILAEKTELFIIYCEMLRANEKEKYQRKIQEVKNSGDDFFKALNKRYFKDKLSFREEYFKIFPYSSIREGKINFGKAVSSENLTKLDILESFNRFLAKFKGYNNNVDLLLLTMEFFHEEKYQGRKIPSIIEDVVNINLQILSGNKSSLIECLEDLTEKIKSISESIYRSELNKSVVIVKELLELAEAKYSLHQIQTRILEENILDRSWPLPLKTKQALKGLIALSEDQSTSVAKDMEFYQQRVVHESINNEVSTDIIENLADVRYFMSERNKRQEINLNQTRIRIKLALADSLALVQGDDPASLADESLVQLVDRIPVGPTGDSSAYFFSRANEKDMIFDWFQKVRQDTGFDFKYDSADKTPGEIGAFIRRAPMGAEDKQRLIEASEKEIGRISGEKGLREFKKEIGKSTPEVMFDNFYQTTALVATGAAAIFAAWFLKKRNSQEVPQNSPDETAESSRKRRQAIREEERKKEEEEAIEKAKQEEYLELIGKKNQLDVNCCDIDFARMEEEYTESKEEFRKILVLRYRYPLAYYSNLGKAEKGFVEEGAQTKARLIVATAHDSLTNYDNMLKLEEEFTENIGKIKQLYAQLPQLKANEDEPDKYSDAVKNIRTLYSKIDDQINHIRLTKLPNLSEVRKLVEKEEERNVTGNTRWIIHAVDKSKKIDTISSTYPSRWEAYYKIDVEELSRDNIENNTDTKVVAQAVTPVATREAVTTESKKKQQQPKTAVRRTITEAEQHRELFIGKNPFIHSLCSDFYRLKELRENPPKEKGEIYIKAMRYYIMRVTGALYEAVGRPYNSSRTQIISLDGDQITRSKPIITEGSYQPIYHLRNQIMHSFNRPYFNQDKLENITNILIEKLSDTVELITTRCNLPEKIADFSKVEFTDGTKDGEYNSVFLLEKEFNFLIDNLKNFSQDSINEAAILMSLTTVGEIFRSVDRKSLLNDNKQLIKYASFIKKYVRDNTGHLFGNNIQELESRLVCKTERGQEIYETYYDYYKNPVEGEENWKKCALPVHEGFLQELYDSGVISLFLEVLDKKVQLSTSFSQGAFLAEPHLYQAHHPG